MSKSHEVVDSIKRAEAILARARAECLAEGLNPQQLAKLLLPEALLAFMVAGLEQDDTVRAFRDFAEVEIAQWYAMVNVARERCDCAREHIADLRGENESGPAIRDPASNVYFRRVQPRRFLAKAFRPPR